MASTWRVVVSSWSSPGCGAALSISDELEREELGARRLLLLGRGEAGALVAHLLPGAERGGDALALRRQSGELVEQIEMRGGIEQHLVLVLPVQIDERAGGLAQRRARDERAVDEGAAASLRRDLAADDHLAAVRLLEHRLDGGGLFAGPDELGAGAAADEQADGADEDGLAGAGLAGEDVEAGREFELESIDDGEVGDAEEPDHSGGSSIVSDL